MLRQSRVQILGAHTFPFLRLPPATQLSSLRDLALDYRDFDRTMLAHAKTLLSKQKQQGARTPARVWSTLLLAAVVKACPTLKQLKLIVHHALAWTLMLVLAALSHRHIPLDTAGDFFDGRRSHRPDVAGRLFDFMPTAEPVQESTRLVEERE